MTADAETAAAAGRERLRCGAASRSFASALLAQIAVDDAGTGRAARRTRPRTRPTPDAREAPGAGARGPGSPSRHPSLSSWASAGVRSPSASVSIRPHPSWPSTRSSRRPMPSPRRSTLTDGGEVTAHWSESLGKAVLVSDGLPTIADDESFELWFVRDGGGDFGGNVHERGRHRDRAARGCDRVRRRDRGHGRAGRRVADGSADVRSDRRDRDSLSRTRTSRCGCRSAPVGGAERAQARFRG